MVEKILHESGRYQGYMFMNPESESIALGTWGNVCRIYSI
jgi:hypothetical protein